MKLSMKLSMIEPDNNITFIVEDEYVTSAALKGALEDMGYSSAGVATTEDEAITLAREEEPDVILMDIVLRDGSSGISAAGKIKEGLDIPVLYLTATPLRTFSARPR